MLPKGGLLDPDECLREILELLHNLAHGKNDVREDLVEHLRSPASWLERGGFAPDPKLITKGGTH